MLPRFSKRVRNWVFFFFLSSFFLMIWLLVRYREEFENCWAREKANCGQDESTPLLILSSKEPLSDPPPIMLLEGHFHEHLSPRMLCTIESAAITHTNTLIYVFMTSRYLQMTPITQKIMIKYVNLRFVHLNATKLFQGSPLESWFNLERWKASSWPKSHFNDALRWMIIWKYGGIYLDLDVIVAKNLMQEWNFAGLESDEWVGAGALKFTKQHPFVEQCLKRMNLTFDGQVWGANGPELLTNTLVEWCGMELPSGNLTKCPDIRIYHKKAFYPIPWWKWYDYIRENAELSEALILDPDILAFHVWNFHTHDHPVLLYESNPFAVAATNFCPIVVYEVGYQF